MPVPATPPKVTLVAPVRPVPVTVTVFPPPMGPPVGFRAVTWGVTVPKRKLSAEVSGLVPAGVVTEIPTVPAAWAGAVAVILMSLFTVNDVAAVPPKLTAVAPVNPEPLIVTIVPPPVEPVVGETLVIAGPAAV